jgi:hypothetical protein
MKRRFYIELDEEYIPIFKACGITAPFSEFKEAIDTEPVRHGHWINGDCICPCCGEDKFKDLDADIWSDWQPEFCPNCGAKMDEERKEE